MNKLRKWLICLALGLLQVCFSGCQLLRHCDGNELGVEWSKRYSAVSRLFLLYTLRACAFHAAIYTH